MDTKVCHTKNQNITAGLLLVISFFLFVSCGSNRKTGDSRSFQDLDKMITDGRFAVENQWALPLGGSMIDLIGNSNFIRFKGDSVNLFLPYFGVRQFGGGYGDTGGLDYKGLAENLKLEKNLDDKEVIIQFEANRGTENLGFTIRLYPDGSASTSVTSSHRNPISYRGHLEELPEDKF